MSMVPVAKATAAAKEARTDGKEQECDTQVDTAEGDKDL